MKHWTLLGFAMVFAGVLGFAYEASQFRECRAEHPSMLSFKPWQ